MCDFIQLFDDKGEKLIDTVAAAYEDSFTLETFSNIIQAHRSAEPKGTKCAIIARVQTWDRNQPDKAFFSYYDAIQLNKVLFKTQVYMGQKLIHRLHVLNPLTNSDILGNVLYFKVSHEDPDTKLTDLLKNTLPEVVLPPSDMTSSTEALNISNTPQKALKRKNKPSQLRLSARVEESRTLAHPLVRRDDEKDQPITKVIRRVSTTVRGPMSAPVGTAARRISNAFGFPPTEKKAEASQVEKGTGAIILDKVETDFQGRKRTTTMIYKESPKPISIRQTDSVEVPQGAVTQFSQPIKDGSKVDELRPFRDAQKLRDLSFANSASVADAEKYSEWIHAVSAKLQTPTVSTDLDTLREKGESNPDLVNMDNNAGDLKGIIYTARLIGTDMEYLESSKLRGVFRKNAVDTDEAKLLEMPPVNEQDPDNLLVLLDDDWFCCGGYEKRILQVFVGLIVIALIVMFVYMLSSVKN